MTSIRRLTDLALNSRPRCPEHPEQSMIDFTGCAVCRHYYREGLLAAGRVRQIGDRQLDGVIIITIKGGQVTVVEVTRT